MAERVYGGMSAEERYKGHDELIECWPAVLEAAKTPYRVGVEGEPFNLLVFGGSQGAQFFSDAVPAAIAATFALVAPPAASRSGRGVIARSTLTFSSRTGLAVNKAGGSMQISVRSWSMWFWIRSRSAPEVS